MAESIIGLFKDRADPSQRAVAGAGRRRGGHLGMGRLVQQPAPLRIHRRHSPSRSRSQLLPHNPAI